MPPDEPQTELAPAVPAETAPGSEAPTAEPRPAVSDAELARRIPPPTEMLTGAGSQVVGVTGGSATGAGGGGGASLLPRARISASRS